MPHMQKVLSFDCIKTLSGLKCIKSAMAASDVHLPMHNTERVLLQCTCTLLFVKALCEEASHFLSDNNKLDSHLIVYGRSVTAYFPL